MVDRDSGDRRERRESRDDSRESKRDSRDRRRRDSRRREKDDDERRDKDDKKKSRDEGRRKESKSRRSSSRGRRRSSSRARHSDDSRDSDRRRGRSKSEKKQKKKKSVTPTRPTDWRSQIKWDSPSRSPSPARRRSQSRSRSRDRRRASSEGRGSSTGGGSSGGFQESRRKSKWDDSAPGAIVPVPTPPTMPQLHGRPSGPGLMMLLQQPGTKAVRIPDVMVGRIVGRGGQMIKKLNEVSGCQIGMERDHSGSFALIRGPNKEMAERAEELIMKELRESAMKLPDQEKLKLMNDDGAGGLIQAAFLAATRTFQIGIEHIPRVLGAGGDTIYAIQRDAGCTVKIEGNGTVVLTRGTPEQMDHAQALVMAAVEESKQLLNEKGKAGKVGGKGGIPPPPPPGKGFPVPPPPGTPSIQLNGKGKEQYQSMSQFASVGLGSVGGTQL